MQIAFNGKGGSGKSTICALFIDHLRAQGQHVLAIDADINVHLADLLGVRVDDSHALSHPENALHIRRHLLGQNQLIGSADRFVKTTPPGPGSNAFSIRSDHPVTASFATPLDHSVALMHVGTYETEDIGTSCYHVNLGVLENLLSHAVTERDEWIVCDMVAGTDAFSNSLHAQFDVVAVVVEPTPESVSVARKYLALADAAGTLDTVMLIGNKVIDDADRTYLESELGADVLLTIGHQPGLRRARQEGRPPRLADLELEERRSERNLPQGVFAPLEQAARTSPHHRERRLAALHELHRKYVREQWVVDAHGDLAGQIPAGQD